MRRIFRQATQSWDRVIHQLGKALGIRRDSIFWLGQTDIRIARRMRSRH